MSQAVKALKEVGALTLTVDRRKRSEDKNEEVTPEDMEDGDLTPLGNDIQTPLTL